MWYHHHRSGNRKHWRLKTENWRCLLKFQTRHKVSALHTFSSLDLDDWKETNYDAKSWLKSFKQFFFFEVFQLINEKEARFMVNFWHCVGGTHICQLLLLMKDEFFCSLINLNDRIIFVRKAKKKNHLEPWFHIESASSVHHH